MATPIAIQIKNAMPNVQRLAHFTWQRSALLGAGLAFAWSKGDYWHTPLIFFAPSAYAGYQTFKARDQVRTFIVDPPKSDVPTKSSLS